MPDAVHGSPEQTTVTMSPAEKAMCEWEARHDTAARGRRVDPAAALQHYISHTRCEEELHHHERPHRDAAERRRERDADRFAVEHPLAASLLRWGEDPRR